MGVAVLIGTLLLTWSGFEHGVTPLTMYLFAGLVLAAVLVTSNSEDLLTGSGWKGALVFLATILIWLPGFYILYGVLLADKGEEANTKN